MPIDLIKDKLKELGMSDEDLQKFANSINQTINEQVGTKVKVQVKEKVESEKKKYDVLAEEYCNKKIKEGHERAKKNLAKVYDRKMMILENKYIKKLDQFIDSEIIPQVSDRSIEKIAMKESFEPIVKGMKTLLESHGIAIDKEGSGLLKEAKQEIVKLRSDLSGEISKNMKLKERMEKAASHFLMTEATEGLNPSEKKRVVDHFKGQGFDDIENRIGSFVEVIVESRNQNGQKKGLNRRRKTLLESAKPTPKKETNKVPNPEDIMVDPNELMQQAADNYL